MIKLNNKNITYVALADSNNSLKAPKEIWYADSSNSVKLVYRRKDALIEGEDYEKYHWLNGDGSAYIDTNIIYLDGVVDLIAMVEGEIGKLGRERLNNSSDYYSRFVISINPSNGLATVFSSNQADAYITQPLVLQIDVQNDSLTLNGTVKSLDFIPNTEANSIYLFAVNRFNNPTISSQSIIKISKFSISSKINLIPCKLLKPVPKWLDANGIRRQIGECGMIDLVSGKFFGNVNSVGTFTVENYYERKEWLVGDGSAYIDTDIIVDVPSLYISTSFTKKVGGNTPLFGSRNYITSNGSQAWYLNTGQLRLDIISNGTNWITIASSKVQNVNQLIIDCPNKVASINEVTVSSEVDDLSIKNSIYTFKIFSLEVLNSSGGTDNTPYHGAFRNFTLNDSTHSLNLIPCTLTMDLPASMDANNIARTKGTSGMWDLVSDKFYGNVANSGTFKAVNLAEGVDYEVHQWLKGDLNSYIQLDNHYNTDELAYIETVAQLYDSSNPHVAIIIGNNNSNDNGGYCLRMTFYNPNDLCDAHRRGNGHQDSVRNLFNNDYGVHTYYLSLTDFIVDGVSYPFTYGSRFDDIMNCPWTRVIFGSTKFNSIKLRTNNTTFSLIPVKLLHSIPSEYDANGIARQAGECGMYDTVNDVFYGNVASSGSFTVSDDE